MLSALANPRRALHGATIHSRKSSLLTGPDWSDDRVFKAYPPAIELRLIHTLGGQSALKSISASNAAMRAITSPSPVFESPSPARRAGKSGLRLELNSITANQAQPLPNMVQNRRC